MAITEFNKLDKELILMQGIPCSGKTTVLKKWMADNPTIDKARNSIDQFFDIYKVPRLHNEELAKALTRAQIECFKRTAIAMAAGTAYIFVDNEHIRRKDIERYEQLAKKYNYIISIWKISVSVDECTQRHVSLLKVAPEYLMPLERNINRKSKQIEGFPFHYHPMLTGPIVKKYNDSELEDLYM